MSPTSVHVKICGITRPEDAAAATQAGADAIGLNFVAGPRKIDPDRAMFPPYPSSYANGSETVYVTAVDQERNAVSFISSIYMAFGSGMVVDGTGIILQNRGHSFSLDPGHPNRIEPHKRPRHTIIPGMVFRDGQFLMNFGVMGGDMQPQGHVQVVVAMVNDGLDPQGSLDRPRFRIIDGKPGGRLALEEGIPSETMAALARRGHAIVPVSGFAREIFGRGQVIQRDPENGVLWGGSDPRADGCALCL